MENYNNRIGIIIQARTSSTRLPKKIIREFSNTSFLDILLSRFVNANLNIPIILASTVNPSDSVLSSYAEKYKIPAFFGSEHNVLKRFIDCSNKFNFDYVVRVCSDNPYIDITLINQLVEDFGGEDYLSFEINKTPSILTHSGFFSEMFSVKALKKIYESKDCNCIEHVTNCLYQKNSGFNIKLIPKFVPSNVRCTLDSKADFEILKTIYYNWFQHLKNKNFEYKLLLDYLESNPKLIDSMKSEILNNKK